jgi:asparagine synthase (glutamine-hydrolysing)
VVCFGLGLQERVRPEPDQVKPVLAAAMQDTLPDAIRLRRDKRSFNEVHYLGVSRNAAGLKRLVEDAAIDDFGIFDKAILLRSIEEAALGVVDPHGLYRLDTALAAIAWLTMEGTWQSRPIEWRHTVTATCVSTPGPS